MLLAIATLIELRFGLTQVVSNVISQSLIPDKSHYIIGIVEVSAQLIFNESRVFDLAKLFPTPSWNI